MAITRVNLPLLLRAAISHRNATALPLPHHISPTSFLRSHPSTTLLSNPHSFSTFLYRRVYTRATAHLTPLNLPSISNPSSLSISNQHLFSRSVHTRATALHKHLRADDTLFYALIFGCIAAAGGSILYYRKVVKPSIFATISISSSNSISDDTLELRFNVLIPHMYRMGHFVLVEGLVRAARPITENKISNAGAETVRANDDCELYLSATEVLARPHHVATALQRNTIILAVKKIFSEDNDNILAAANRLTTSSGKISTPADDLSEPKRIVFILDPAQYSSWITEIVKVAFGMIQDLPKSLKEGHSVFIKGLMKPPSNLIKFDEINKVGSGERNADKRPKYLTAKNGKLVYQFLAETIAKDDEKYMSWEAAASAIGQNVAE